MDGPIWPQALGARVSGDATGSARPAIGSKEMTQHVTSGDAGRHPGQPPGAAGDGRCGSGTVAGGVFAPSPLPSPPRGGEGVFYGAALALMGTRGSSPPALTAGRASPADIGTCGRRSEDDRVGVEEALPKSSPRRKPGCRSVIPLDSGYRRNDGWGLVAGFVNESDLSRFSRPTAGQACPAGRDGRGRRSRGDQGRTCRIGLIPVWSPAPGWPRARAPGPRPPGRRRGAGTARRSAGRGRRPCAAP